MPVYAYVRVSTDMQDYNSQKTAIDKVFAIDEWIEDTGTGKITQPNLQRLINIVQPGDRVIVYAFDRLGRNTASVIEIVNTFKRQGVGLQSVREGLDITSASGNMVFQMMCSIAEFEATLISDRVKQGMRAAKKRGQKFGSPTLLERNPKTREAVIFAKRLRAEGVSFRVIREFIYRDFKILMSYGSVQRYIKMPLPEEKQA